MKRPYLALPLAALAAFPGCDGCGGGSQADREPVAHAAAPGMPDAPVRFGRERPSTAAEIPAGPVERPPRPPKDVPVAGPAGAPVDVEPGRDPLPAALDKARRVLAAPRPLLSVPLKQLLGPTGAGVHFATGLKIAAEEGSAFSLSLQANRLGVCPQAAYLGLYRDGLPAPVQVDVSTLKRGGWTGMVQGRSVDQLEAGGQKFGVLMTPNLSDQPRTELEVWPGSRPDKAGAVRFTIADGFMETARAGARFKAGDAELSVVAYKDQPSGSGLSVALFDLGRGAGMRQIPAELLARPDGKLVTTGLLSLPGRRFGLRLSGSGVDQVLEIRDATRGGDGSSGEIALESLVKSACP